MIVSGRIRVGETVEVPLLLPLPQQHYTPTSHRRFHPYLRREATKYVLISPDNASSIKGLRYAAEIVKLEVSSRETTPAPAQVRQATQEATPAPPVQARQTTALEAPIPMVSFIISP